MTWWLWRALLLSWSNDALNPGHGSVGSAVFRQTLKRSTIYSHQLIRDLWWSVKIHISTIPCWPARHHQRDPAALLALEQVLQNLAEDSANIYTYFGACPLFLTKRETLKRCMSDTEVLWKFSGSGRGGNSTLTILPSPRWSSSREAGTRWPIVADNSRKWRVYTRDWGSPSYHG